MGANLLHKMYLDTQPFTMSNDTCIICTLLKYSLLKNEWVMHVQYVLCITAKVDFTLGSHPIIIGTPVSSYGYCTHNHVFNFKKV